MAQQSKTTLKTYFNTGDKPTEAEFGELIDSQLNSSGSNILSGSLIISTSAGIPALEIKGDITASGNISASGTVYASTFESNG